MVEPMQLHNAALQHLASASGAQWDDGATQFVWALLGAGYTQADGDTTWTDLSANEVDDGVQTDYVRQAVGNPSVTAVDGAAEYHSDPADFGDDVTLEAKWLALVHCASGSLNLQSTDVVIGVIDLDSTSGSATKSSTNNDFDITEPASGWFNTKQADA